MFIPAAVKARVESKIAECLSVANKHYKPMLPFKTPVIKYDVRGTVGGYAYAGEWKVDFNSTLLMENLEHFIDSTVPHEIAHLVDHAVYGVQRKGYKRVSHGATWKSVMRLFGCDGKRTHQYDVQNAQVKKKAKFHYVCTGCKKDIFMGPVRHKKQKALGSVYFHCRHAALVYQAPMGQVTYGEARESVAAQKAG